MHIYRGSLDSSLGGSGSGPNATGTPSSSMMMQVTAELDGSADGRNPRPPALGKGAWVTGRSVGWMEGCMG